MRLLLPSLAVLLVGSVAPLAAQTRARPQAIVWVNAATGVYHCPGSRFYGTTADGEYMTEAAARGGGNRAAEGTGCPPETRGRRPVPARKDQVWVDTQAGRYHCPGSRDYAGTARGRFSSETAAKAAKVVPVNGRGCAAGRQ